MKLKSYSIMLGYKEYNAKIMQNHEKKIILYIDGIGPISPANYVKNAFKPTDITSRELDLLIHGGYENQQSRFKIDTNP